MPFKGPGLASNATSGTTDKQGHRQVCRARRKGPRTLLRTTDRNLDCVFVDNTLVLVVPKIGRAWVPLDS